LTIEIDLSHIFGKKIIAEVIEPNLLTLKKELFENQGKKIWFTNHNRLQKLSLRFLAFYGHY
jgi:hypothetical protein